MEILTQNDKIKKTAKLWEVPIFNWSIPAYRSANGDITCPFAGECSGPCYAQLGNYLRYNVKNALEVKYTLSKGADFVPVMGAAIAEKVGRTKGALALVNQYAVAIRIHDSGDFYSKRYLNRWLKIMRSYPDVFFYAYTKSVGMIKGADLPPNFSPIFSYGGKQDSMIGPNDRHAKVFQTVEQLEGAGYSDCSQDDLKAALGSPKVGLAYHGINYRVENRPTLGV